MGTSMTNGHQHQTLGQWQAGTTIPAHFKRNVGIILSICWNNRCVTTYHCYKYQWGRRTNGARVADETQAIRYVFFIINYTSFFFLIQREGNNESGSCQVPQSPTLTTWGAICYFDMTSLHQYVNTTPLPTPAMRTTNGGPHYLEPAYRNGYVYIYIHYFFLLY